MSYEVLIIESRSYTDIYKNTHEGRTLQEILRMQGIQSHYAEVATVDQLTECLKMAEEPTVKYVHISAHGAKDGFQLTDNTFITWADFDRIGWPILKDVCIVFSSCDIAKGVKELFEFHKTFCNAIVAPAREIYWEEGLVAYAAFYHRATKNNSTKSDVEVMNRITEPGTFKFIPSPTRSSTFILGT